MVDTTGSSHRTALSESLARENRFRRLFDNLQEGFVAGEVVRDESGKLVDFRYLEVNRSWEHLTGISRHQAIGRTVREVIPEVASDWVLYLSELIETGHPVSFTRHVAALDRWYEVQAFQPQPEEFAIFFADVSDRRLAYVQLRESEEHFRNAAELNPQVAWTATPDGQLDQVSHRWFEWTGITGVGTTWAEALHPDDRDRTFDVWTRSVTSGEPYDIEHRARMRDGSYRWMHSRAYPRRDQFGRITNWYGTTEDINDRRVAEDSLRELNALLQDRIQQEIAARSRIWDNSQDLQLAIDTEGRLQAVNPAWESILGYSEAEIVGSFYLDLVHPDDHPTAQGMLEKATREGLQATEIRIRALDGSFRHISWVASPPENNLIYASGRDTTSEHAAANALKAAEARTRSIFETSFEYLGFLSVDGILQDTNAASLDGIRARREDVIGRYFWETPWFTNTPGMPERIQTAIRRAASGESVRQEIVVTLPTGRRTFDFSVRPVIGSDGQVTGILPEAVDITDRKQAEEQVAHMQKMESIGQITGGIAHDFNNLLTPILGTLDVVRRRFEGDARTKRLTGGAIQAAERARVLIQRLLAFARRQNLQASAVNLQLLVDNMFELMASSLGPGIQIELKIPEDLPPAIVDPNQLELAILNLAINARDAMAGSGKLTIQCDVQMVSGSDALPSGRYHRLMVTDTGIGMDEQTLKRAVEPFFTTKGVGQGTGLGLSMVYGLAIQSGGDFSLSSLPGAGTTATIWLPAGASEAATSPATVAAPALEKGKGTILLVDDEELVRSSTADMMVELGFDVVDVASGMDAVQKIQTGLQPVALVTDFAMPGLSGTELAVEVRKLMPGLPVLLITGYADLSDSSAAGLTRLAKPFRVDELGGQLARLLAN